MAALENSWATTVPIHKENTMCDENCVSKTYAHTVGPEELKAMDRVLRGALKRGHAPLADAVAHSFAHAHDRSEVDRIMQENWNPSL